MKILKLFFLLLMPVMISIACGGQGNSEDKASQQDQSGQKAIIIAPNGRYVTCRIDLRGMLVAETELAMDWEYFFMVKGGNSTVAFRAINNKYISADLLDNALLVAKADTISDCECFTLVEINDTLIRLKACNGYYVMLDSLHDNKLFAKGIAGRDKTEFMIQQIFRSE